MQRFARIRQRLKSFTWKRTRKHESMRSFSDFLGSELCCSPASRCGRLCRPQAQAPYRFDSATVSGLPARNIGSATMSGRIAALDAVEEDGRITVFVGAASGGVWKSVNGGTTYKPVFDREDVQSIGAVAIDPSNSKIVWVGTGEAWMRNSVSVGDGVYKSTDGGENWTNVGLEGQRAHREDPGGSRATAMTCWPAPPGICGTTTTSAASFKTTDGGKTWKKVLAGANGSSGCAMIARASRNRRPSMPRCGTSGGRAGRSAREARAAGCSNPPTAAPLDRSHEQYQGTAGETLGPRRRAGGAVETAGRVCQ